MKKYIKILTVALSMFAFSLSVAPVSAASDANDIIWGGADKKDAVEQNIGLGTKDPRVIISSMIKVVLGFLGVIAVVMILLAGFKWMTAAGNQSSVDEARKMLINATIGLVLVLSAYGLATYIIGELYTATQ